MSSTHLAVAELADVLRVLASSVAKSADAALMRAQIDRCDRVIDDMRAADAEDYTDA